MESLQYKGLRLVPSTSAMREMSFHRVHLKKCPHILENGYDAPRKRKKGTIEKWFNLGNKTYNIVIAEDYNELLKEKVWVIVHCGKFTRK